MFETVYNVYAWHPQRMVWTLRSSHTMPEAAALMHGALKQQGLRVRIIKNQRKLPEPVKPAVDNSTRAWREAEAARMIDLADARKRYKSPG